MNVIVVGLGYVGSVAAAALAEAGHRVLGVDKEPRVIEALRDGRPLIHEEGLAELVARCMAAGRLEFLHTSEVDRLDQETGLVCVGTPGLPTGGPDLSQVREALRWLKARATGPLVVAVKSTVPPGGGLHLMRQELSDSRLEYVANPEFLREGRAVHDWFYPDRIVIGARDRKASEQVAALYEGIEAPRVFTDITSAEVIKYAANAFLATKISFINEIANLCDKIGASVDDVVAGISPDPRIGPLFLRPGLGYGGSCFPKDVRALDFISLVNGHNFELLRSVISVNNRQRILPVHALREVFGSLVGVPVALLGLAFKPGTNDVRESPALEIMRLLAEQGAEVRVTDPMVRWDDLPETWGARFHRDPMEALAGARAAILVTEWPQLVGLEWPRVREVMEEPHLLFDGRNALDPGLLVSLGFRYRGVGRPRVSSVEGQAPS